jgi:hypothetical protein
MIPGGCMMLIYAIVALALLLVARTIYIMGKFRRLAAEQKRQISSHMADGMSLAESIGKVISQLNRTRGLGLDSPTISAVSKKLADLSSIMDISNVADILGQFTQRYLLLETRIARSGVKTLDNSKVLYAAEHLDLQERNGYYLIKPSTQADFATKYSNGS